MEKPMLIVEKAEPYELNEKILLLKPEVLIGRTSTDSTPDIAFSNSAVSRKHLILKSRNAQYSVRDLNSKHGTRLNDLKLNPQQDYLISPNDIITLSEGSVILRFTYEKEKRQYNNDTDALSPNSNTDSLSPDAKIFYKHNRRQFLIDGTPVLLSGKDFDLMLLLFNNRSHAVSNDTIKTTIWPERCNEDGCAPTVELYEINTLIYRLRKKLNSYGHLIISLPRFGYMLDLDS